MDYRFRPADGIDITRAGNPFQFCFQGMRHTPEFGRTALRILCPQRHRNNGDIIDTLGLDQRLANPCSLW